MVHYIEKEKIDSSHPTYHVIYWVLYFFQEIEKMIVDIWEMIHEM